jgi:hypothetical protein
MNKIKIFILINFIKKRHKIDSLGVYYYKSMEEPNYCRDNRKHIRLSCFVLLKYSYIYFFKDFSLSMS